MSIDSISWIINNSYYHVITAPEVNQKTQENVVLKFDVLEKGKCKRNKHQTDSWKAAVPVGCSRSSVVKGVELMTG